MRHRVLRKIHYGWFVVGAGLLCIMASLGFGRFALGMLLPSMGNALSLSYSDMGIISTANFVGYLVAVLGCGFFVSRFGARKVIIAALLLVAVSMIGVSGADSFTEVLILYMLTGVGSGASNVPMMALVSSWFVSRQRGRAAGFVVIGSGFAILISGKLVPFLNQVAGNDGWRLSWLALGCAVFAITLVCWLVLRDDPLQMGLVPVGSGTGPVTSCGGQELPVDRKTIFHLGAIYFLFGYTYVIYATFIVTALVQEKGFTEISAGSLWSIIGFLSIFSGPVFGTLSDKLGRKAGLVMVFSIQTLSYLFISLPLPRLFLFLSIGCFGIVAWSIPSIMAAVVGDVVGPKRAARAFGFITFIFGIGQIAGPYLAGRLAESTGSFSSSFAMATLFALAAVVLSAMFKKTH